MPDVQLLLGAIWNFLVGAWIPILVVVSLVGLVLSSVLAYLSSARLIQRRIKDERAAKKDPRFQTRLIDVEQQIKRHAMIVMWNGVVANTTMIGQYLVGGVLGTSFFQHQVDATMTGLLGVWVIISTAISKHYRPALRASQAKARKLSYEDLARYIEDGIHVFENGITSVTLATLRKRATGKLKALDDVELRDDAILSPAGEFD